MPPLSKGGGPLAVVGLQMRVNEQSPTATRSPLSQGGLLAGMLRKGSKLVVSSSYCGMQVPALQWVTNHHAFRRNVLHVPQARFIFHSFIRRVAPPGGGSKPPPYSGQQTVMRSEGTREQQIRRTGFAGSRRKITENRLRFGRDFSFRSDFLPVTEGHKKICLCRPNPDLGESGAIAERHSTKSNSMFSIRTVLPSLAPILRRASMIPARRMVRWNQLRLSSSSKLTLPTN